MFPQLSEKIVQRSKRRPLHIELTDRLSFPSQSAGGQILRPAAPGNTIAPQVANQQAERKTDNNLQHWRSPLEKGVFALVCDKINGIEKFHNVFHALNERSVLRAQDRPWREQACRNSANC